MMNALQTLVDNGLSDDVLDTVLDNLLKGNSFDDENNCRCCVALKWSREQGNNYSPEDCTHECGDTVSVGGAEYRVLTDDEAYVAYKETIEQSLWAFNASFLSGETGIDDSVFVALAEQCEGCNDAVRSIVDGSCGIDSFVESAVGADGRGHFLNHYDGEENEFCTDDNDYWYLYRTN